MTGRLLVLALLLAAASTTAAAEPAGLHGALAKLAREGRFSGAVVVRGAEGVRFARGYGWADPFEKRAFTPDTPADSGSLVKPVTAAAVLLLIRDGKIEPDAPVRRYLPEFPHAATTVRQLLSHSAGLELKESAASLANKSNAQLLSEAGASPLFPPGSRFVYCNLCSITLALLIERVTGTHYLDFVKTRLAVPDGVRLRPQRLADWRGRAIGYRVQAGKIARFDSWEGELLYGAGNFSISAAQMAQWGAEWWKPRLQHLRPAATTAARIGDKPSGLTLGNWYCAPRGRRCHYLGHHEGFHHMLYWDADRRISIAMVSNNTLAPGLHQRLQRALVAFAEGRRGDASRELGKPLTGVDAPTGRFALSSGETVEVAAQGDRRSVRRAGVVYPAYPVGSGIRYVPGLDLYVAGRADGRLQWLTLYDDLVGEPAPATRQ